MGNKESYQADRLARVSRYSLHIIISDDTGKVCRHL